MGKILPKCQICDGPIVNGTCKYCGMPYRRDEMLYHLNENRRDHEAHAKTKHDTMKKRGTPQPEKKRVSRSKNKGILIWVLILLFFFLPRGVEWIQEKEDFFFSGVLEEDTWETAGEKAPDYLLCGEDGELLVGGPYLQADRYRIFLRDGYATLKVVYKEEVTRYPLSEGETETLRLKEGAVISVHNASSGKTYIEFYAK